MDKTVKCNKGCHKYKQTIDEIVDAATKHKEPAIAMKEVGEKQKRKIEVYKQQIEHLEIDVKELGSDNDLLKRKNHDLCKEVDVLERNLKTKIQNFNQSEEDFQEENDKLKERVEWLCRKNEMNFKEIGQFCWDLEEEKKVVIEKNKEILGHEKKKEITDKIIKNLQLEKNELKEEVKTLSLACEAKQTEMEAIKSQKEVNKNEFMKNQDHVQRLLKEIEDIQNENLLKRTKLEEALQENDILKENLAELDEEHSKLKEQLDCKNVVEDIKSLSAELEIAEPCMKHLNYACIICDKQFETVKHLKDHKVEEHDREAFLAWKTKEAAIHKQILDQKLRISSGLLKMKENEEFDAYRCICKGFCRIFHHKHNWKVSQSRKLANKFEYSL